MTKSLLALLCVISAAAGAAPRRPIPLARAEDFFTGAPPQLADQASRSVKKGATSQQQQRVRSVAHFTGQLTAFDGQSYPYTMVGHRPEEGGTTRIPTAMMAISFFFPEFVDGQYQPITLDAPDLGRILLSPEFQRASYATGHTQFSDAIQRAQFWNVMAPDWHTLLEEPRMLPPLEILVPPGLGEVDQLPDGTLVGKVDYSFFISQVETIVQVAGLSVHELPMLLTQNIGLSIPGSGCCALGFHSAWEGPQSGDTLSLQTYLWASYVAPGNALGRNAADVGVLSHEIAEWYNDPFGDNLLPAWQLAGAPPGRCNYVLETGDAAEFVPNAFYPLTLNGFTYHPQNEALLQWFEGESPSSAYHGAYSFPDLTALTGPATACPQ